MIKSLISGFVGAILGGGIIAVWLYFFSPQSYVLDIKGIIDSEREKVLKQVEEKNVSQEEAGKKINAFFDDFNNVLEHYRKQGRLILVKDAVLSGGKNITDEFKRKLIR